MGIFKKNRYFYTRRDRHHSISRNRRYRNRNTNLGIYAVRGGPRIGFYLLIIVIFLGLFFVPMYYIGDETKLVSAPIDTPSPTQDEIISIEGELESFGEIEEHLRL